MTHTAQTRAATGRLMSGVVWNALGRGLPLVIALLLTPWLLHLMGVERWGLFTLALAMVGVLGVLDLGVGPASPSGCTPPPRPNRPIWCARG